MKIENKHIVIISVSALILIMSVYTYSVSSAISGGISGALILKDQKVTYEDYEYLKDETFSTTIYLPGDNCEGVVNYCSYVYKSDVNANADINKDGKIDEKDARILIKAYGCDSTESCWNEAVEECFFIISGRKFRDPTRDCEMDQSDQNLIQDYYGKLHDFVLNPSCETNNTCKADINQDGIVNVFDAVILGAKFGSKIDSVERLVEHQSEADINDDGDIDIFDAVLIGANYGKEAIEQKCSSFPISHISGRKYSVSASGKGLYYAGVSYLCPV